MSTKYMKVDTRSVKNCNSSKATLLSSFYLSQIKKLHSPECALVVIQHVSLYFQYAWSGMYDPISFLRFCSNLINSSQDPHESQSTYFALITFSLSRGITTAQPVLSSHRAKTLGRCPETFTLRIPRSLLRADPAGSPCFARSYSMLYVKSAQREVKYIVQKCQGRGNSNENKNKSPYSSNEQQVFPVSPRAAALGFSTDANAECPRQPHTPPYKGWIRRCAWLFACLGPCSRDADSFQLPLCSCRLYWTRKKITLDRQCPNLTPFWNHDE